jgi:predicted DNA binding CopG/RHH family protein
MIQTECNTVNRPSHNLSTNSANIRVRCSEELKDAVTAKAAAEFLNTSAFIRRLLAKEMQLAQPRTTPTEPATA